MTAEERIEAAEAALKRIAALPAPEGLEDRLDARLCAAARQKPARVFAWPGRRLAAAGWLRAAAAAAIVAVVGGGGWGLARHLEQGLEARQQLAPRVAPAPAGGFATGGAMRTPQTVEGPLIVPARVPPQATKQAVAKAKAKNGKAGTAKAAAATK